MALIHVVIPVYNARPFLRDAVRSVLDQPCKDIEIILVDDGSTDGSSELCDELVVGESRISVIHQQNRGVSAARNKGIERVLERERDGYIAFLDADDMWSGDFLDEETKSYLLCQYDLVGFLTARCNNAVTRHTSLSPMKEGIYRGGSTSVWLNSKQTFGSAFYALSVIEKYHLRFMEEIKANEDLIFSMQFKYLAKTLCLVNKRLYLYRNNTASASHKYKPALELFVPLIYAYLQSDELMEKYQNEERGVLKEGRAMAAVYIVDVFEEHYKQWGSKRALTKMMQENPKFEELITSSFAFNRPDSGLRWQTMIARPTAFRIKNNIKGIAKFVGQKIYRTIMRIPCVAQYLDRIRYPIAI